MTRSRTPPPSLCAVKGGATTTGVRCFTRHRGVKTRSVFLPARRVPSIGLLSVVHSIHLISLAPHDFALLCFPFPAVYRSSLPVRMTWFVGSAFACGHGYVWYINFESFVDYIFLSLGVETFVWLLYTPQNQVCGTLTRLRSSNPSPHRDLLGSYSTQCQTAGSHNDQIPFIPLNQPQFSLHAMTPNK